MIIILNNIDLLIIYNRTFCYRQVPIGTLLNLKRLKRLIFS